MKYKIFISSVQKEFKDERKALRDFICGDSLCRRYFDIFFFEDIPAQDRNPDQLYLKEVKGSDIYVCLLGNEYGAEIKGISPTEQEFDAATKTGKVRLLFIKDGPDRKRHPEMIKLINKACAGLIRRKFSSVPDLISKLYAALVQYLENAGVLRNVPHDAAICEGATLADIDKERVRWFLETAKEERKFALDKETPASQMLAHLDLLDAGKPTHAAVLLFGKKPQRFLPLKSAEVKCLHFHTTEIRKPIPSYQIYKGTAFEQVDEAVDFVLSKLNRSVTPGKNNSASDVAYEIPKYVVREAVVNAVAHRDYTSKAGIQVMLFVDRVEVWNPGELPEGMTPETLRVPHSSVPRNPLISEPLFLAHYIERAGTGTLDMIALCKRAGLPEPTFEQRGRQFVTTIWRDWLTTEFLSKFELSERQSKAIDFIKLNKKITNKDLRKLTGAIYRTASRDLDDLVKKGLFRKVGKTGRGAYYVLAKKTGQKQDKHTKLGKQDKNRTNRT